MLEIELGTENSRDDTFWEEPDLVLKTDYAPALFTWIDCLLDTNATRIAFDMKSNPRFVE